MKNEHSWAQTAIKNVVKCVARLGFEPATKRL